MEESKHPPCPPAFPFSQTASIAFRSEDSDLHLGGTRHGVDPGKLVPRRDAIDAGFQVRKPLPGGFGETLALDVPCRRLYYYWMSW